MNLANHTFPFIKVLFVLIYVGFEIGCNSGSSKQPEENVEPPTPYLNYSVVAVHPHDTTSYTEGLLFHGGQLFESEGHDKSFPQTRSLFGSVDLKTGKIDVKAELDPSVYFGEGITFLDGKLYQLTYKNKIGFIYDAANFKKIGEFPIPTNEGWGMTTDGTSLIMSDGTEKLTWINPQNFQVVKTITVTDGNAIVINLNELEWLNGNIYANIFGTEVIAKIDPQSGKLIGKIDLSALKRDSRSKYAGSQEMNGIAFDSTRQRLFITGKLWPSIYEIQLN